MADLNRIRDRLSAIRQDAQSLVEQRQSAPPPPRPEPLSPPPGLRPARQGTRVAELEAELDALEAYRSEAARRNSVLSGALAKAELAAEQAGAARDRAQGELEVTRAELQAARVELEEARAELEGARAREAGTAAEAARPGRSQRKSKRLREEKRIAALEGELETERERRQDAELALEQLQRQRDEDARMAPAAAPAPVDVPAAPAERVDVEPTKPEPVATKTDDPPSDGWGMPIEAFPLDARDSGDAATGTPSGVRPGRRSRLRTGRRVGP